MKSKTIIKLFESKFEEIFACLALVIISLCVISQVISRKWTGFMADMLGDQRILLFFNVNSECILPKTNLTISVSML